MVRSGRDPVVFGAAVDLGAGRRGAALGPAALRGAGLLPALGPGARDRGDLHPRGLADSGAVPPVQGKAHHLPEIAAWVRAVRREAEGILAAGGLPVLLGGDHSLSMGSVAASARAAAAMGRPLFLFWLDAHGDFNTPATSPSGNLHGMSLAALCGEPGLEAVWSGDAPPPLAAPRVHILGARDLDAEEAHSLAARGIGHSTPAQCRAEGLDRLMHRLLQRAEAEDGLLHVSFDVDVLDPALAPGVGTPVADGLDVAEVAAILAALRATGRLLSLDIVELNPLLDASGRSAALTAGLMAHLFGTRDSARRAA